MSDILRLRILDIVVKIHFIAKESLPIHESLKVFAYHGDADETRCLQVKVVENPIDRVTTERIAQPGDNSIKMYKNRTGLLFSYSTGQFHADPKFTNVQLWSPYDRQISKERDGVPNFNGDPGLRLILWGRAGLEGCYYMHGALNVLDDKYILFMGDSGVGKTTLSSLAGELGATCLTEEDPFLAWRHNSPTAYGTPWPGIKGPDVPKSGKLAAIFILRHAPQNQISRLDNKKACRSLLHNSRIFKWLPQIIPGAIELIDAVSKAVPVYDFGFVPDHSAVEEIRKVL